MILVGSENSTYSGIKVKYISEVTTITVWDISWLKKSITIITSVAIIIFLFANELYYKLVYNK